MKNGENRMRKENGVSVTKILTDVRSNQKNGPLHEYNYFEDESGKWIYKKYHYC